MRCAIGAAGWSRRRPATRRSLSRGGQAQFLAVSDAVEFTPEGGSIAVRVACLDDRVLLAIRDSGIGIPADEQKDLFARFYRTRDAARRAVPGSGLGLSIVKAIVDAHDGEVMVESAVSEGSTFRVLLPANHSRLPEERSS